jgi:hypothetical protein
MISKKLIVALALLLGATSATLAQNASRAYYDYYGQSSMDRGYTSDQQPGPGSGVESQR